MLIGDTTVAVSNGEFDKHINIRVHGVTLYVLMSKYPPKTCLPLFTVECTQSVDGAYILSKSAAFIWYL